MKLYLIDYLPSEYYHLLYTWLKKNNIELLSEKYYSPKQHREFDKLYVTIYDVIIIVEKAYSKEETTSRYNFTETKTFKAIEMLIKAFNKLGYTFDTKPLENPIVIDGKVIISRLFDSWQCSNIRSIYYRATNGKQLPKYKNKLSYVSIDELEIIKTKKIYGKETKKLVKKLDELLVKESK